MVEPRTVSSVAGDLGLNSAEVSESHAGLEQHLGRIEELLERLEQRRG